MNDPIPAATLIIMRASVDGGPDEILFAERAADLAFAGGMSVFPGGRVDSADRRLAGRTADPGFDVDDAAHRIAAIRETLEETGLALAFDPMPDARVVADIRAALLDGEDFGGLLDRCGLALRPERLVPFARWMPDNGVARIFDARFYLARYEAGVAKPDGSETARLFWAGAQAALDLAERGEIGIIYPTRRNLERLAVLPDFSSATTHASAYPVRRIVPFVEEREGERYLAIPDDAGYPVTRERLAGALRE